jgi:hypothetical protein
LRLLEDFSYRKGRQIFLFAFFSGSVDEVNKVAFNVFTRLASGHENQREGGMCAMGFF